MSGGVDSSAAALLLLQQGYEVAGVTLRLFSSDDAATDNSRTCCSLEDVEDARRVCYKLGIDHYTFGFDDAFKEAVIRNFIEVYAEGGTPNPCIECNRHVKFSKMLERATIMGFDYIATGHYAIIEQQNGRYLLKKGKDIKKDQSYMLYGLSQEILSRTLFPLGSYTKPEIREIAAANGLINADKPDSQDICFVKNGDYTSFLQEKGGISPTAGDFIDINGNRLGTHKGIIHYTIGQRKGLNLSFEAPRYVVDKNPENNTVTLGVEADLLSNELTVGNLNWVGVEKIDRETQVNVKIRYSQSEAAATLIPLSEERVKLIFSEPQRAISRGQSAVFYQADSVLGGGVIE